jgi:hypothetical protein
VSFRTICNVLDICKYWRALNFFACYVWHPDLIQVSVFILTSICMQQIMGRTWVGLLSAQQIVSSECLQAGGSFACKGRLLISSWLRVEEVM